MTIEEDIVDFANAIEAAAVNLKHRIGQRHGVDVKEETKPTVDESTKVGEYNPEKIPWVRAEGEKGIYERYPAYQQKPVMLTDYINLLEDLKRHTGKLQRAGLFYWHFQDSVIVARKPSKK